MTDFAKEINIAFIGEAGVGKTCLIHRYKYQAFTDSSTPTMGVDFFTVPLERKGKNFEIRIWDTAGQERFRSLSDQYLKGCDGIVMVYDILSLESFQNTEGWFRKIEKNEALLRHNKVLLLGNKSDMNELREVEHVEGEKLCEVRDNVVFFFECSAKTGGNVGNAINEFVYHLCDLISSYDDEDSDCEKLGNMRNRNKSNDGCGC